MPKHQKWFWLTALVAAWLMDFLFWKSRTGISFLIWTIVLLAGGYLLAWREGKKPSILSALLTVLILGFASVLFWRNEPFTRFISVLFTLGGMLLLTATFTNGNWPWYRLRDYFIEFLKVIGAAFSGAISLLSKRHEPPVLEGNSKPSFLRRTLPVLRGVLIALPIVALLAVLLSSADPVFGDWLKKVLDLEKLPEYLFRLFYILLIASLLVGVYLHAILPSKPTEKPDPNTPWVKQFLGMTESSIILGAVNLLFIAFIVIQVRYLFGGEANISETGYTYADYARRGFGELVAVALLSIGLYLALSSITRAATRTTQILIRTLSILLMVNVLVMLASSFQRLLLYEKAYGFTSMRTYPHIFILWLGGLMVSIVVLEVIQRRGHFALMLLIFSIGFAATVALINVDGYIVTKNMERVQQGEKLDIWYLNSLSLDGVPEMIRSYQDPALPAQAKNQLGTVLACRQVEVEELSSKLTWKGTNLSTLNAVRLINQNSSSWEQYKPHLNAYDEWVISVEGEEISCTYRDIMD